MNRSFETIYPFPGELPGSKPAFEAAWNQGVLPMRCENGSTAKPQLLLVEDDETLRDVLDLALTQNGYRVETASTGAGAIEKASRHNPEIVLLDIQLPDQSGYLVAAKLKLVSPAPKLLFLTALPRGQSDRMAAFVRADGIMHKPFSVSRLLSRLDDLLGLARAA